MFNELNAIYCKLAIKHNRLWNKKIYNTIDRLDTFFYKLSWNIKNGKKWQEIKLHNK